MTRDDIIRLAHQAGIVFRMGNTDVTVEKLERFLSLTQAPRTRGFLWFWLRPEGGEYRQGFNLTILHNGFVLGLLVRDRKYRFRFRRGIKPKFLWSKEP